jgi:hypothetical protein
LLTLKNVYIQFLRNEKFRLLKGSLSYQLFTKLICTRTLGVIHDFNNFWFYIDIQKVDIVMLCQITCLEAHPGVEKAYPAVTHEGSDCSLIGYHLIKEAHPRIE